MEDETTLASFVGFTISFAMTSFEILGAGFEAAVEDSAWASVAWVMTGVSGLSLAGLLLTGVPVLLVAQDTVAGRAEDSAVGGSSVMAGDRDGLIPALK